MAEQNGNSPPEDQQARTIAARIVGKLQTLHGVSFTTRGQLTAIDVVANEVRPLTDGITERDAELVREGLWRDEQKHECQRLHNRIDQLHDEIEQRENELRNLRAGLDDTDVIEQAPKCEHCQGDGKHVEHHMRGHYPETLVSTCDACQGTGRELMEQAEPGNQSLVIDATGPTWDELADIATRSGGPG